jgi:MFS family permease
MLVQFAAGGAVLPFVSMLMRDRGLEYSRISLIFSAASALMIFVPFIWGVLADRYTPLNRLFALLNAIAGASLMAFAMQTKFAGLLLSFVCFYVCFNPTMTLINSLSFHHIADAREQFGFLRAWGSLGWVVPSLPISLWLAISGRRELGFVIYLGAATCAAMAVLSFWLPHTPPGVVRSPMSGQPRDNYTAAITRLLRDPNYLTLLISSFLASGSYSLLQYYSPPFLEGLGVPRPWIGPIQAIGVLFEVVLFQFQARFFRRFDYATTIVIGCLALLARHLMFTLLGNVWLLSASYVLAGAAYVFYFSGVSVLVNAIAGAELRSTAQTLLILIGSGVGPMFANGLGGRLAAGFGESLIPVFALAAVLAGLAALLIGARGHKLNAAGHPPTAEAPAAPEPVRVQKAV